MLTSSTYSRLAILLFTALLFTACGGEATAATEEATEAATVETEEAAPQGPEYTSAYVCPMHCDGSGSAEPGKCPVCQMDYVANADHPDHAGGDHDGHDHGQDDGHNH